MVLYDTAGCDQYTSSEVLTVHTASSGSTGLPQYQGVLKLEQNYSMGSVTSELRDACKNACLMEYFIQQQPFVP